MFCIIPHGCSGQITRTGMRFNAWGVTVSIGFPFAAAVTLMLFYDASGTIACLSAALFHEGGHLLCLKGCGETPRELRLGFAGMEMIRSKGQRLSFAQEVAAALSGICSYLPCCRPAAYGGGMRACWGLRWLTCRLPCLICSLFLRWMEGGLFIFFYAVSIRCARLTGWLRFFPRSACCHALFSVFFSFCAAGIISLFCWQWGIFAFCWRPEEWIFRSESFLLKFRYGNQRALPQEKAASNDRKLLFLCGLQIFLLIFSIGCPDLCSIKLRLLPAEK